MRNKKLWLDNDNWVRTETPLKNSKTGAFLTAGATVTSKLEDLAGNEIVAPQAMAHTGSDGMFDVIWDKTLLPSSTVKAGNYKIIYDFSEGGQDGKIVEKIRVEERG